MKAGKPSYREYPHGRAGATIIFLASLFNRLLQKLHKCGYAKEAGVQAICLLIVHGPSDGQGAFFTLVRIA